MIFAILDTEKEMFIQFGAKIAWATARDAKSAYTYHRGKFSEQTRYEIVELTEQYFRLKGLEK